MALGDGTKCKTCWWWESCSYGCFHIGRIWILHWDCSMERLFPSTHHICHSLQLREWACFWWRNCTGPHLFQAVWVDGGGLPFVPEACWWLGRTVMELMMMQNSGGIMKQSTVIALCIPITVHKNPKIPGIYGVSRNTQTIAGWQSCAK